MNHFIPIIKHCSEKSIRAGVLCLALVSLTMVLGGCGIPDLGTSIEKSVDNMVTEISKTMQTIERESTAWRDELPKLTNSLRGLESQVNADAKGILADATNQVQDLATQTLKMSDAYAQDLIAQAGVEFRCNAGFVKAGVKDQLQYMIDDLKFWKLNRRHLDKKPNHAVCWINPNALALYPSGSNWSIDASNMADRNIVRVFGYNFWPEALPTLELQNAAGQKIRNVSLMAAYVTHYQLNLDFSSENFSGVSTGARVVFRWPDKDEPNTISLTLQSQGKLKISNPVFTPSSPTAQRDSVTLGVRITNQGGLRSGNFVVNWTPDPNDTRVLSISRTPLNPGESVTLSFPGYVYQRGGTIGSKVSLSNGDDTQSYSLRVAAPIPPTPVPTPTPLPSSNKFKIEVTTGNVTNAGTDADVFITLFGDRANSNQIELDTPGYDNFERGRTDTFNIVTPQHLGNLTRIRIRHDDSGLASGWFLERIVITNVDTAKRWTFNARRWLATDEGDRAIDVFLSPN